MPYGGKPVRFRRFFLPQCLTGRGDRPVRGTVEVYGAEPPGVLPRCPAPRREKGIRRS